MPYVQVISPELRIVLRRALKSLERVSKKTSNRFDDAVVAALKVLLEQM